MDLQVQRQRLLELLQQVRETDGADTGSSLRDYQHELSVFDNHPADFASEDYQRTLDAALRANDARIATMIENALSRIERGEYQYCVNCGGKIAAARLEALPYADTCADCAEEGQELGGLGKEPTEPVNDGDPTWPMFNRYGTSNGQQDQPGK